MQNQSLSPRFKSRDSSVRLAKGRKDSVRFPAEAGNSSVLQSIQTGSGAHSASYSMGTGDSFLKGKAEGAWSSQLTAISAKLKNGGAIPPLPQETSWFGAWFIKHRDNFTFPTHFYRHLNIHDSGRLTLVTISERSKVRNPFYSSVPSSRVRIPVSCMSGSFTLFLFQL
jgi:hypothetical protein